MGDKTSEPAAKAEPKNEELRAPHEHAVALGQFRNRSMAQGAVVATIGGGTPDLGEYSMQHRAAEALHGWKDHAHHAGAEIRMTAADYKAALVAAFKPVTRAVNENGERVGDPLDSTEAANAGIATLTDYEPHQPAESPYSPHRKAKG